MKKILIIGLTNKMGGVETFIRNTTVFSNKDKYEYYFLVHGSKDCVFSDDINKFYGDNNHIFYINSIKKKPISCFFELVKFYKKNKFDLIHLQTGSTAEVMYVFPFIIFNKIKLISHSHNGKGKSKVTNNFFKPLLNMITSKYLACSLVACDWLFGKKRRNDCVIINNGIDTDRFKFNADSRKYIREKYNVENKIVIGNIGRFSTQKNHDFLIDIFNELHKKNSNYFLMLIGVGDTESQIKEKVNKLNLNDSVLFLGKQMETEKFYSSFDIFLMPSLYEGLPVVGIEAQCSGLNCYFSDTIDEQILISDKSKMIPLNANCVEWSEKIMKFEINKNRSDYSDIVNNLGYGIKNTVKILEKIYEEN